MNFRTLDLNLLRVFDVVMVERNVTRAAARLSMTQPAVSNALRRLREATHEELFIAGSTGVTPTAHAEAVWPAVREALDSLRTALDPQDFDPRRDARAFTLAMADATASVLMPALVSVLDGEAAQAEVHVVPLSSRDPQAAARAWPGRRRARLLPGRRCGIGGRRRHRRVPRSTTCTTASTSA